MTEKMKGSKILIESLKEEGVTDIFGYPGGTVLEIYDALYSSDLNHYLVRHEQAAAHAADGYARSSGKVGVCLATSGPGATNLITGIATANMDSIPMVIVTGQVNTSAIGKDAFQEADITGITMPITKHNYLVKDVNDLAPTIKEAFHIARNGRPGPVLVDIPKDVTINQAPYIPLADIELETFKPTMKGHPKQIEMALKAIIKSKRPVILAGGGILASDAVNELRMFVKKTSVPIVPTLMAMGVFPDNDPLSLKYAGMHGTAYANLAIYEADLLIAIGMRFDDRITGKISEFAKNAQVIHIDIDPAEIGKSIHVDIPVVGDAKHVLNELLSHLDVALEPKTEWLEHIAQLKREYPLTYDLHVGQIMPQAVVEMISTLTAGKAIITTDVGEHQMWAAQYLNHTKPRRFISSGGLGTMGFGLPAAVGAQVANPKDMVVVIAGDGSIQMNIQELSTVAFYKLPIKIAILNNEYLGMVRQWQQLFYDKRYSHVDLQGKQPDFLLLAQAYGILGLRATKPEEIKLTLEKAFSHPGPVLMDFRVLREENVFPMVPAGGVLNKIMFKNLVE